MSSENAATRRQGSAISGHDHHVMLQVVSLICSEVASGHPDVLQTQRMALRRPASACGTGWIAPRPPESSSERKVEPSVLTTSKVRRDM